jgi:hypothetical protein
MSDNIVKEARRASGLFFSKFAQALGYRITKRQRGCSSKSMTWSRAASRSLPWSLFVEQSGWKGEISP